MISREDGFLNKLATELRNAHLEAIVVGNVAGILNGAPVFTHAVDLLVRGTPFNRKKLKHFATAMGGAGPERISGLTSTDRIYGTAVAIDILYDQMIGGLTFASVRSRSHLAPVGDEVLTVAALADVIKSKTAAGRPKDKAVLPILHDVLAARRVAGLEKP